MRQLTLETVGMIWLRLELRVSVRWRRFGAPRPELNLSASGPTLRPSRSPIYWGYSAERVESKDVMQKIRDRYRNLLSGEVGLVSNKALGRGLDIALAYANTYYIGMSN